MRTIDSRLLFVLLGGTLALSPVAFGEDEDPFGWDDAGEGTAEDTWEAVPVAPTETSAIAEDPRWAMASVDQGRRLYRSLCSGCHGIDGDGQSQAAATMDPKPRDLTRGDYRFRTTASGHVPLKDDLLKTLRDGLPGTEMPAWGTLLDDGQLRSLVVYVVSLSPRFARDPLTPEDILVDPATVEPAPVTPELIARGEALYQELQCGKCHGDSGQGDGPAADTLVQSDGQPSTVFDFTYGTYKGGPERVDLYRTFTTGLDGTPMPSYADSLPDEEDRWALEAYCRSLTRDRGLKYYLTVGPDWQEPMTAP